MLSFGLYNGKCFKAVLQRKCYVGHELITMKQYFKMLQSLFILKCLLYFSFYLRFSGCVYHSSQCEPNLRHQQGSNSSSLVIWLYYHVLQKWTEIWITEKIQPKIVIYALFLLLPNWEIQSKVDKWLTTYWTNQHGQLAWCRSPGSRVWDPWPNCFAWFVCLLRSDSNSIRLQ